jgi:uncharacterized protein (AIM24 family)
MRFIFMPYHLAFIKAGGTLLERELKSGQALMVDAGCQAALSP